MDSRLSKIETLWSMVRHANATGLDEAKNAQQQLWDRYQGAARRYLAAALPGQESVDEVMQELALKIVRRDFRNADENKGSFRAFMKTVLFRMVADYRRKQARSRERSQLEEDSQASADDGNFAEPWRDELMSLAWIQLEELEQDTGSPLHTVLRAKIDHPERDSSQLAQLSSEKLGKTISDSNYRVLVHRAREKFSELLVRQIAQTIDDSVPSLLEEELAELGLLQFCQSAFERYQPKTGEN